MKKFGIGLLSAALILGAGTTVFGAGNSENSDKANFGRMLPMMEEMHPDLSTNELREMYKDCHGDGGMMESKTSTSL
ncbi:MAG: hypothetical protein K6T88_02425 [Bacillus sp. (in: Bacteria)]|nr:hypothetical protein [Bacillus sp. (in: firmicutes)]